VYRFVCRGWRCLQYIDDCVESLQKQTIKDWVAYLIVDAATQGERIKLELLQKEDPRLIGVPIDMRVGVCCNMYCGIGGITGIEDEDVVCILDLDDKLLTKKSLETVDDVYRKYPNTLCTYGSFIVSSTGKPHKICKPYPDGVNVRKYKWRASHLKTFKYKVFDRVPQDYFMHKGEWGLAASDLALMYCIIERAGLKNCRFIKAPIYWYRYPTEITCNRGTQKKWKEIWRAKTPLSPVF